MPLSPVQEAALALLEKLVATGPRFDAVNHELKGLHGDFYPHQGAVAECIEAPMLVLLDQVLGDGHETATYFLYEHPRGGRKMHMADGSVWPLQTIAELRAYLEHYATQA